MTILPESVFEQIGIGSSEAVALAAALRLLSFVRPESLKAAIATIERCESIGPIIDPTFFVRTPDAFENGRSNRRLLEAVLKLRQLLPESPCLEE